MKSHRLALPSVAPIDFQVSLEVFRRSGDDLLDRWDGEWLLRTLRLDQRSQAYACRPLPHGNEIEVVLEDGSDRARLLPAIVQSFHDLTPAFRKLCQSDPLIERLARQHEGFRPPLHPELLVALVRCISAQQVNLRWAATVRQRIALKFGHRHEIDGKFVYSLEPKRLAALDPADLRALQLTTRKSEYVINAARAIAAGDLSYDSLKASPDDEVIARIIAIRGLGLWSAEWILARTLARPRVSAGDLGVRKAVGKAYFDGMMPTVEEVRAATAHWRDAAAFAQELLLHAQHQKTLV